MNSKKIVALVFSFMLCSTSVVTPQVADVISNRVVASADTTGSCGDNATYSFDSSTGTLTISGTGDMTNYDGAYHDGFYNVEPWLSFATDIKKVIINDGITFISDHAFSGCTSLSTIYVSTDNINYLSEDGILFNKDKTKLICYPADKKSSSYTIPASVTFVNEYAFYKCTLLADITIPDSITFIGKSAFAYCKSLTSIIIPNSVTFIGGYAFDYCTSLTNIILPNNITNISNGTFANCESLTDIVIPNGVTSIGNGAFIDCKELRRIIVPNNVTSIGEFTFSNCSSLKDVYYTGVEEEWDKITLSDGNVPLTNATIHYNVTNVDNLCGDNATWFFDDTTGTLTISGTGNMYDYEISYYVPWYSFKENIKKVVINDGITSIGRISFSNCTSLTNITIPNSVTSIGESAFAYCKSLTNITMPNSITSIANSLFFGCTSLTNITIPNGITSIDDMAFGYCTSLTNVTIPHGVTFIGALAFYKCTSLTSITIPSSITIINNSVLDNCDALKDVYYTGTEEEWNETEIDNNNSFLTNATIHYKQSDNTMIVISQ